MKTKLNFLSLTLTLLNFHQNIFVHKATRAIFWPSYRQIAVKLSQTMFATRELNFCSMSRQPFQNFIWDMLTETLFYFPFPRLPAPRRQPPPPQAEESPPPPPRPGPKPGQAMSRVCEDVTKNILTLFNEACTRQ